ncbi:hypothetical protein [Aquibacillus rhizosphaerae]|uniref:DnaD domain-containing protein n=1 Tax=Aquibacillus rhizosphaerae TaxID=3051431 RepID=A0ABT7L9H1_9BACI|nr:hypothetical protein [Aquibacillus sp. LR5S19]MDL4842514.1 hypothetical protein [Aquibacillus sp. LR5S19]
MNYLKELNAFKEWMLFHDIPACAVLLWHTLMLLNNSARRIKMFNAPNSTVEKLSGLSSQRISEARKILVDHNLISYQPGFKGKAPIYQMKSLVSYFEELSPVNGQYLEQNPEEFPEQLQDAKQGPSRNEARDIHKEKEKEKGTEKRGGGTAQHAFTIYEQNIGILKPIVQESLFDWCDDLGDELVIVREENPLKKQRDLTGDYDFSRSYHSLIVPKQNISDAIFK